MNTSLSLCRPVGLQHYGTWGTWTCCRCVYHRACARSAPSSGTTSLCTLIYSVPFCSNAIHCDVYAYARTCVRIYYMYMYIHNVRCLLVRCEIYAPFGWTRVHMRKACTNVRSRLTHTHTNTLARFAHTTICPPAHACDKFLLASAAYMCSTHSAYTSIHVLCRSHVRIKSQASTYYCYASSVRIRRWGVEARKWPPSLIACDLARAFLLGNTVSVCGWR